VRVVVESEGGRERERERGVSVGQVVVVFCGWQITVAKTVGNSIKLRANNRRRSILVDVVYIILLFAITKTTRKTMVWAIYPM